ncbi:MAG TPA: hypothetical protein VJQ08_00005, partial [Candidatus Dormibacteraeota bacterium]|nr:hypothetical protein [Candidatus Dormibacteraeota bacterium]
LGRVHDLSASEANRARLGKPRRSAVLWVRPHPTVLHGRRPDHYRPTSAFAVPALRRYLAVWVFSPVRILVTWLFNSTGGSVPIAALFHAAMDTAASAAVLATFYPWSDGNILYIGFAVIAVVLIVVTRGRLGYRRESPAAPEPSSPPRLASTVEL